MAASSAAAAASATLYTETGVGVEDFIEFDYVIVGGGTAGLVVAARLSEDPSVTVGVIEAGLWRPEDPKINLPVMIGQTLMDPDYDWCMQTEPQVHSNGRKYAWPRGRLLGGSSGLNFLVAQRGYREEYNDIGRLGNKGWSWDDFASFCRKSDTFHPPSSELQKANLATCDEKVHGTDGPIQTSFSAWYTEAQRPWFDALKSLGLNNAIDGLNGKNRGLWASPTTVCPKKHVRSYSANAYYEPNKDRKNLKVLTGANASKIEFQSGSKDVGGQLVATGVHFTVDGRPHFVKVKREVVLSAGTVKSPQILELSGVGRAEILKAADVHQLLELDVGENVQEHLYCTSSYKLKPGHITWDKMRSSDFAKEAMELYHAQGEDRGIVASAFSGFAYTPLKQYLSADEVQAVKDDVNKIDWTKYSKGVQEGIKMQLARLDDEECPFMEFIFAPGFFATASPPKDATEYFSILSALQQPFSRGTIHIASNDPTAPPKIDPAYFSVDADLQILSKAVRYCNKMVSVPSLREIIVGRQDPDPEKCQTEDDFREYTKDQSVTEYHHIGSCSMMPRDKGGVVDERLKVHGTSNVRVADASIIPLHVSSHIVSAVYAVGEKAAHMIREDAAGAKDSAGLLSKIASEVASNLSL